MLRSHHHQSVKAAIEAHRSPVTSGKADNYITEHDRLKAVLGDDSFPCNVRYLSDVYNSKGYNLQYSVMSDLHATDFLPTFINVNLDLATLFNGTSVPKILSFGAFALNFYPYLVSHARSGEPNTYKKTINVPPAITKPRFVNTGHALTGVLEAPDLGFTLITDQETKTRICNFWGELLDSDLSPTPLPNSHLGVGCSTLVCRGH